MAAGDLAAGTDSTSRVKICTATSLCGPARYPRIRVAPARLNEKFGEATPSPNDATRLAGPSRRRRSVGAHREDAVRVGGTNGCSTTENSSVTS